MTPSASRKASERQAVIPKDWPPHHRVMIRRNRIPHRASTGQWWLMQWVDGQEVFAFGPFTDMKSVYRAAS